MDMANEDFTDDSPYELVIAAASRKATSPWTEQQKTASVEMIAAAESAGSTVIYLEAAPIQSDAAVQCVQRAGFDPLTSNCGTSESEAYSYTDNLGVAMQSAGATTIGLEDLFCKDGFCPFILGQVIVYLDAAGHVTGSFVETLLPILSARLDAVGAP